MNTCNKSHRTVIYDMDACPACQLEKAKDHVGEMIRRNENLEDAIETLESRLRLHISFINMLKAKYQYAAEAAGAKL
jgi:hypothetical protein